MNALMTQPDDALLVTYTLFPTVWPTTKTERGDVEWRDLVQRIERAATYIDKQHCPLISMAEYGDEIVEGYRSLRCAENVRRIFGVEVDYDGEQLSIGEAADKLIAANLRAILYTSPSHTREKPRWRALFPLCEPAIPEKRAEYVGRANNALGGIASRESFTLSQSFYIGRVRGAEYEVQSTPGRCIDTASDLEPRYYVGYHANGGAARDGTTDEELRAAFERGEDRYQAMLKLSARWAARGLSADDIEGNLLALLGAGAENGDGLDLRTRARPLAESAVRKYGETRSPPVPLRAPVVEIKPPPEEAPRFARTPLRWAELAGKEPPERPWRVAHWLGLGTTLLAGRGGIGKTHVAQTLATALALGRNYLDAIAVPQKVLFWACEDDHDELWRRQLAICALFGASLADLQGRLILEPRLGRENTLFYAEYGAPKWTALYGELTAQVNDYASDVTFIDNAGQTFGGKENDRHHVTVYMNGLTGLAPARAHSTVLLAHPGKQEDSEFSGSTAWENAVRMRWYMGMKLPDEKPDEEREADPDVRFIAKRKTNYTAKDYRKLVFQNGVFAPEMAPGIMAEYSASERGAAVVACILKALDQFEASSIRVTDGSTSPDYLPKRMRETKLAQDFSPKELAAAMQQLRLAQRIVVGEVGKYGSRNLKFGLKRSPPGA